MIAGTTTSTVHPRMGLPGCLGAVMRGSSAVARLPRRLRQCDPRRADIGILLSPGPLIPAFVWHGRSRTPCHPDSVSHRICLERFALTVIGIDAVKPLQP